LRETRELMLRRHTTFLDRGNTALEEMRAIDARLDAIKAAVAADYPLSQPEVETHRARIAGQVMAIHDVETAAVEALKATMATSVR
jgi:hypothetical protein